VHINDGVGNGGRILFFPWLGGNNALGRCQREARRDNLPLMDAVG
jgi:hypothetical protein